MFQVFAASDTQHIAWKRVFILKCTDCDTKPLLIPSMTKMGRNRNSKHKISMVRGVGGRDKRELSAFMKTGRWWLGFVLWPLRWCVYSYIYKSVASTCSLSPLQFWLRVFNTKLTSSYCANCHHCPWYCHRRACRVVVWVCVIFFICSLSSSLSLSSISLYFAFVCHSSFHHIELQQPCAMWMIWGMTMVRVVVRTLIVFDQ